MKYFNRFYIFILLFFIVSCKKDFLDTPDNSFLLRQAYVTDLTTTAEYLNGVYILLAQNIFYGYNTIYPELAADNVKPVTGSTVFYSHYSWTQQANELQQNRPSTTSVNMNGIWTSCYHAIQACNFVLQKADEYRGMDAAKADTLKGQSYALRALMHSVLVNTFAQPYNFTADASHQGVPYVVSSVWAKSVSRQTVAEVYSNMIEDLNSAIQLLPASSPTTFLFNRNAAKALLARIYFSKGDYNAAKNLATEVSAVIPIMSIANGYPDNIFKTLPSSQTEALFQLPPQSSNYGTAFASLFFKASKQFIATNDIATILTEKSTDVRKSWVTGTTGAWNITKFPSGAVSGVSPADAGYCQPIIRSSELYLIAAESFAKLNMESDARTWLDAVRKRADAASLNSTASGPALLDSIYKERRKELAFEGFRMFDLLRWKKGVSRADALTPAVKDLPYPSNKAIAPIPALDISLSGIPQNLGY